MKTYSILRTLQDQQIQALRLTGKAIDLGGHKGSSYYKNLSSQQPVEVANLDEPGTHKNSAQADHTFDLEKPFPLDDNSYEHVLCINVMEHIYDFHNLMSESARILKPGGSIHLTVPFLFNIHGSPNDYFRYTRSTLQRLFEQYGFTEIEIHELGDGPCSMIFQNFGGSIPTMFLKMLFKRMAMSTDAVLNKLSSRYRTIRERVPLGYFVNATKS